MSDVISSYRGRQIREADVVFLRELIANNPGLHRNALSKEVCKAWNWVQPNGQLRDQVRRAKGEDLFNHLVHQHHYLGFSRPVGEHLKYLVLAGERPVACLAWNSGPLKLKLRDKFVGAPRIAYAHNLHLIAYNSRYLIVPRMPTYSYTSPVLGCKRSSGCCLDVEGTDRPAWTAAMAA